MNQKGKHGRKTIVRPIHIRANHNSLPSKLRETKYEKNQTPQTLHTHHKNSVTAKSCSSPKLGISRKFRQRRRHCLVVAMVSTLAKTIKHTISLDKNMTLQEIKNSYASYKDIATWVSNKQNADFCKRTV
jgi:hypothetical protein